MNRTNRCNNVYCIIGKRNCYEKISIGPMCTCVCMYTTSIVLDDNNARWLEGYVRWELGLLAAVGYRLDLKCCVASGGTADLAYVSPKSGRAVAINQAGVFADRMLLLPKFLGGVYCPQHDWIAGLNLTGYFLEKRVFATHNLDLPAQRKRLADMVETRYNGG